MYKKFFFAALWLTGAVGFVPDANHPRQQHSVTQLSATTKELRTGTGTSRRSLFEKIIGSTAVAVLAFPSTASAAAGLDLEEYLYKIMRVREATQQERRLIQTGKFKDKARQNIKLAVKFMIQNYELSDSVVGASAYLQGNSAQMRAIDVGQAAVQNLQTILEYFDSSDVENIKVDSLAGKEGLVIKGLESAQLRIDDFLSFFPTEKVASIKTKIQEENALNVKEFDPALGDIINLPPPS